MIFFFVISCEKRFKNMSFLVYYSKMKDCCPLSDISELSTIYVCLLWHSTFRNYIDDYNHALLWCPAVTGFLGDFQQNKQQNSLVDEIWGQGNHPVILYYTAIYRYTLNSQLCCELIPRYVSHWGSVMW